MKAVSRNLAVLVAMRHWAGQCPGDAGWHISALTGREALSAAHEMTLTLTLLALSVAPRSWQWILLSSMLPGAHPSLSDRRVQHIVTRT